MIRNATISDVPDIHRLITHHAEYERMLFRTYGHLYEHLRDFFVATADADEQPRVVACGALELVWRDLAEIKSLAVDTNFQGRSIGRSLVEALLGEGRRLGLPRVFALTREPDFFKRIGFTEVPKETLPYKVWTDCVHCPRRDDCDEVAMVIDLKS